MDFNKNRRFYNAYNNFKKIKSIELAEKMKDSSTKLQCITLLYAFLEKFGVLPDEVKTKIENADTTILEIIVDEILDFQKLENVFKYLK